MSHMTCRPHKARAVVLPSANVVHRIDGTQCESQIVRVDGGVWHAEDILENKHHGVRVCSCGNSLSASSYVEGTCRDCGFAMHCEGY